jgi:ABC-type polysaccharide/polyol phosphate export permease
MSTLVIGSALWSYVFTTVRVFVYLLLGVVVFTLDLQGANYAAALVVLILSIIAFASIGVMAAGIIMIIKRGEPLTGLFSAFANLVGGIYYPVAILPEGLQFVARLIPVTYAVRAMRLALLAGASWYLQPGRGASQSGREPGSLLVRSKKPRRSSRPTRFYIEKAVINDQAASLVDDLTLAV